MSDTGKGYRVLLVDGESLKKRCEWLDRSKRRFFSVVEDGDGFKVLRITMWR